MLIPQYSIRWLLGATAVFAVICSIVGLALQGSHWPAAISIALGALAAVIAIQVLLFLLVWMFSRVAGRRRRGEGPRLPMLGGLLLACGIPALPLQADEVQYHSSDRSLRFDVQIPTQAGFGYRPMRVRITPTAPVTTDRTLSIEFQTRRTKIRSGFDLSVAREVSLAAGSGPVEVTISVPQVEPWEAYRVVVEEDGQVLDPLSTPWMSSNRSSSLCDWTCPSILLMSDAAGVPDTSELARCAPAKAPSWDPTAASAGVQKASPLSTVTTLEAGDFPQRWIDYTSQDVVCLKRDQLHRLAAEHPSALRALRAWVLAGGNLWVFGAGRDWQRLPEMERGLGLSAGAGNRGGRESPPPADSDSPGQTPAGPSTPKGPSGWTLPDRTRLNEPLDSPFHADDGSGMWPAGFRPANVAKPAKAPAKAAKPVPLAEANFLLRSWDLGQVVAFAAEDPFPGSKDHWTWVLNSIGPGRWLWAQRHGMTIGGGNPDFLKFLVPGVGLAPLGAFYVLITLFVLAIGPLNYWLLRRWRRRHLLVLTIPCGAGLVTLALLGYAMLADGFATRVRARSVTWIDQRCGQAACWGRLSFYAGLAPAQGLVFPDDVAVLPLEHAPWFDRGERAEGRTLIWNSPVQWLTAGWLPSRTPTQFLTLRCRPTQSGLVLQDSGDKTQVPKVTNRLGTRIEQLLVRTADGSFYQVDAAVDPGKTSPLQPLPRDPYRRLRAAYEASLPALPLGVNPFRAGSFRSSWHYYQYAAYNLRPPSQASSRLEKALAVCKGIEEPDVPRLTPGSYAAIVAEPPELALGVARARSEAGFHLIIGQW